MQEIAARHAGVCLAKRYRGYDEFLRWREETGYLSRRLRRLNGLGAKANPFNLRNLRLLILWDAE